MGLGIVLLLALYAGYRLGLIAAFGFTAPAWLIRLTNREFPWSR